MNRVTNTLVLLLLSVVLGCSSPTPDWCVKAGICDPPPVPPRSIQIACDSTALSSCNTSTLQNTDDAVLPTIADAPESRLGIWTFGEDLTDIRPVVSLVTPPTATNGAGAAQFRKKQWIEKAHAIIDAGANELFARAALRKSRIAEALGEISRADNPDRLPTTVVYIGDRLEMSTFGSFECQALPTPTDFVKRIQAAHVLTPDSFKNTRVVFAYGNASRHRCPSLARDADVEAIWSAVIKASGGTPEFYQGSMPPLH